MVISKFKTYNSTRSTICIIRIYRNGSPGRVLFITVKINSNSKGKVASWNVKRMKMNISWYPLDYKLHCVLLLFNKCEKWPGVTQLSPHHPAIYELYCKCFWSKNLQRWPFLVWRSHNPKNTAFYSSLIAGNVINNSLKHRDWTATHCRQMPVYHGHKPVLL